MGRCCTTETGIRLEGRQRKNDRVCDLRSSGGALGFFHSESTALIMSILPLELQLHITIHLTPEDQLSYLRALPYLASLFTPHQFECQNKDKDTVLHSLASFEPDYSADSGARKERDIGLQTYLFRALISCKSTNPCSPNFSG
ncbi:hypothetical protein BDW74DRAFT_19199 [Aspergillus multicolor]|uniref:uncharacterized protein n=1 Tax=Aspergillus multicolor TaxID=41759 RepID=UPI003CCDA4A6